MLGVKLTAFVLVMEHTPMQHRCSILSRIATAIIIVLLAGNALSAQIRKPNAESMLNNGALGTEFWIAIPPNEINPFPVEDLHIYVASATNTQITVFDASSGKKFNRNLKANEVLTLSDAGETNWTMEVREPEEVLQKGIKISSPTPISVFVLNSKVATSDGYMALPVSSWDREYIAASYYDFKEAKQWAGGFVIVAREPTKVSITLRGAGGNGAGRTALGKKIGDQFTVSMDEGDVYMIHGDGQTRGEFDLTGSSIVADKPIGVIGFHMRTTMPNLLVNGNGRNHLVEMLPPTSAWGTRYATVELQRENRNNQGKGDVFRVIAKDPNTRWTLTYYDKVTKKLVGKAGGLLAKAGDFWDLSQTGTPTNLTTGYSIWTADKPLLVMQYSCSSSFDGDPALDPFMMVLPAETQYANSALFQFPTSSKFTKHRLNLLVTVDTTDPNHTEHLKSLTIDGTPVWSHPKAIEPKLLSNKMPQGYYWTTLDYGNEPLAHTIASTGSVKFGGYAYGYGTVDAYGWPITGGKPSSPINTVDTLPPVLTIKGLDCHFREYTVLEQRNVPNPPRPVPQNGDQVESGIQSIRLSSTARNLRLDLGQDSATAFITAPKSFSFRAVVIDTTKNASGSILVRDWNNNLASDTLTYTPPNRVDTLPPVIEVKGSVAVLWDFEISDKRTSPDPMPRCPVGTVQVDRGLQRVEYDSVNMRLIRPLLRTFPLGTYSSSLTFEVVDVTKSAWGCVTVFDNAGNSKNYCQQYSPTTSVDDPSAPVFNIRMYVATGQLVIESNLGITSSMLQIYDLNGQVVLTSEIESATHREDLDLAPGVYLASVMTRGQRVSTLPIVISD